MESSYKLMKGLVKTWSDKNKPDDDYKPDGGDSDSDGGDGRDQINLPYV
jgi:hypothetical protein